MTDIIFLTLPRLEMRAPITAPAILKAMTEKHGFSAFCYDLNLDLWHSIDTEKHGHVWFDTDLTFRYEDKFKIFWSEHICPLLPKWSDLIRTKDPRWIGMTIFSQRSSWISVYLCKFLRKEFPNIKIVAGGPFVGVLGPKLFDHNLIDAYVIGEGEEAVINVLNNELNKPGINGNPPEQIDDLDTIPTPDYTDFEMDRYPKTWADPQIKDENEMGTEFIYITGSRGCVRKCSFCDIQSIWPKFRYRSGRSIADEMREQNQRHGSKRFLFTDSLLNGSVKQLRDICLTVIEYVDQGVMTPVDWQGQFIARSSRQMPEEVYSLMSRAGFRFVSIGIESGSEKVRNDMKKMFDNAALDFTFNMCAKYNISMAWLLLVGYPTETEEDFQKTLDMLEEYEWINKKGLIKNIALGPTLDIVQGSPLWHEQEKMGITWDCDGHWVYCNNTREVRIRRWLRLKERCLELGYPVVEKATDHLLNELDEITKNKGPGPMGPSV